MQKWLEDVPALVSVRVVEPGDLAPGDSEVNFLGRATLEDLTPLRKRQMGIEPW